MNLNNIKITIFKELRGIVRDKKSLHKLIIYPLIIPIIILLFGLLFDELNEKDYVVGINYQLTSEEKEIVNDLDYISFKKYDNQSALEKAYENKTISGYIIKDDNRYTIYTDESQNSGSITSSIINQYLETYNKVLGNEYLEKNSIDSNMVYKNIIIDEKSLMKDDTNMFSKTIFSLVIAYITMIIVMACVVVTADSTSGEKERGTLETILTFPIKSSELIIGKYFATAILGFVSGFISYLFAIPAFHFGKELFKSYKDIIFTVDVKSIILVLIVVLLTSLLSSAVCMALAGKSKTYKEAQSSLQIVSFLPIIPYFLSFTETNSSIVDLIPIANCSSLLNNIIVDNINYNSLLIIILSTVIYIIAILVYISKQYKKEETLFS